MENTEKSFDAVSVPCLPATRLWGVCGCIWRQNMLNLNISSVTNNFWVLFGVYTMSLLYKHVVEIHSNSLFYVTSELLLFVII